MYSWMPQQIGAAITPKGSPPARSPYEASAPWIRRLVQGDPVLSSNQLNIGIRICPPARSTRRFFKKFFTPLRLLEMPSAPRLMLLCSETASVRTDRMYGVICGPSRPCTMSQLNASPGGTSCSNVGEPFFSSTERVHGCAPACVESANDGSVRGPGVNVCISTSPPPGKSGRDPSVTSVSVFQDAHGSGGFAMNPWLPRPTTPVEPEEALGTPEVSVEMVLIVPVVPESIVAPVDSDAPESRGPRYPLRLKLSLL